MSATGIIGQSHPDLTNLDSEVVDWPLAVSLTKRFAPPGPKATRQEAAEVVASLRRAAYDAVEPIIETTRMVPLASDGGDTPFGDVFVVDRPRWAEANTQMLRIMTEPMARELIAANKSTKATRTAGGVEVGAILSILSPRVLGQFDPYIALASADAKQAASADAVSPASADTTSPTATSPAASSPATTSRNAHSRGRLLLVAPNILAAERQLKVVPKDFRLWVALHEQTHGLQFAAAPWLAKYLRDQIDALLTDLTAENLARAGASPAERRAEMAKVLRELIVGMSKGESPMDALMSEDAKERFDRISAIMSLLEGHADVMMDAVGQDVIPTVGQIRAQFEKRRNGELGPKADGLLRKAMGMDMKMAQYRDGAEFVRGVEDKIGRDGFNAVWERAENLPTMTEIAHPDEWVRRVHN